MVLSDVDADSSDRILILAENNLVDGLRRSKVWLVEGTFKIQEMSNVILTVICYSLRGCK